MPGDRDGQLVGPQTLHRTVDLHTGGCRSASRPFKLFAPCLIEVKLCFGGIDMCQRGFELTDGRCVVAEVIIDDAQLAVGKIVQKMQPIGAGVALISLALRQRRLQVGNGLRPKLPGGIGDAALVIIPPAATPGQIRGDTVGFAILDVDLAALDRTSHHGQEHAHQGHLARELPPCPHGTCTSRTLQPGCKGRVTWSTLAWAWLAPTSVTTACPMGFSIWRGSAPPKICMVRPAVTPCCAPMLRSSRPCGVMCVIRPCRGYAWRIWARRFWEMCCTMPSRSSALSTVSASVAAVLVVSVSMTRTLSCTPAPTYRKLPVAISLAASMRPTRSAAWGSTRSEVPSFNSARTFSRM